MTQPRQRLFQRVTLAGVVIGGGVVGCSTASTGEPDGVAAVDGASAPDGRADVDAASALVGLEVTPPALVLAIGDTATLMVRGRYADGADALLTTGLVWDSSAATVVTVSASGLATAVGAGAARLTVMAAGLSATVDVTVSGPVLRVFRDDYGAAITFAPFAGSTNGPSIVGAEPHSGTTALRLEVPAAGYTGGAFRSATPVDLSGYTAVTFWARASRAATLNVVGLGNDASAAVYGAEWNGVPLTTAWTRYVVPLPDAARLTAERGLFHVAEGSDEGTYTLWLDDVQYEVTPAGVIGTPSPAIATETVSRPVGATFMINGAAVTYVVGGVQATVATARRYFTFHSSSPAVATVDVDGRVTAVAAGTATITARLGAIDAIGALTFVVTP